MQKSEIIFAGQGMTDKATRRFISAPEKLQSLWHGFVTDAQAVAAKYGVEHSMDVPDFAYRWPAGLAWCDSIMSGVQSPVASQFVVRDGKIGVELWQMQ